MRERGKILLGELHGRGPQSIADPAAFAWFGREEACVGHESEVLCDGLSMIGSRAARSVAVDGPLAASAARMVRRVGSASATNTCSAGASMSRSIEICGQLRQPRDQPPLWDSKVSCRVSTGS